MGALQHEERLTGVHPDLVNVVKEAASQSYLDLLVVEGVRSLEREKEMVAKGASRTLNSRHLVQPCGYGCAVDLAPVLNGVVSWSWPDYEAFAPVMKRAASDLGIVVEWGGEWHDPHDGPHWQLPTDRCKHLQ